MLKKLAVFNFLSVIFTLIVNYFAQAGMINGQTIGEISDTYSNLFTPADYAFSIWGLIYIGLLAFSAFMLHQAFTNGKHTSFIKNTSFWFIIANLANCLWIVAFLFEYGAIAVVIIFLILMTLIKIIWKNNMELWDVPFKVIAFYWWPICIYSGWISIAAITNVATFLTEIDWNGGFLTEVQCMLTMIVVAALLNILIIYTRNMREFALVGVWALVAIFYKHQGSQDLIAYTALGAGILVLLNVAYHGFINRKLHPFYKILVK